MAATQSAKAKVRSMSSPKLRPAATCFDTQSESYSPYKNKLSLISSITSEMPSISSRPSAYQQRSPSLKGVSPPVKSNRPGLKLDLSFNSQSSLPNWV
ncbi:hypothetical protein COLO4_19337 [Corchorus olitorius]|uniref:DUF4005 domain-containing protein n=1 Tax=Corchorus olitorius TaxID=93759 RepID=A0A1R3J5N0_9ROSI|nr:hypothetical protein COLO4_19337 [Corchorus olitorius]